MQTVFVGAADIHARAASHRLQAIQNPDILGSVVFLRIVVGLVFSLFFRHGYRKPFNNFGDSLDIRD
jgi:hypothetical protein